MQSLLAKLAACGVILGGFAATGGRSHLRRARDHAVYSTARFGSGIDRGLDALCGFFTAKAVAKH